MIPVVRFELAPCAEGAASVETASVEPTSSAEDAIVELVVTRAAEGYSVEFANLATFEVSLRGDTVVGRPHAPELRAWTQELFEHSVLPRVYQLHGRPALHGSAVATPHGVVGFLGRAGQGKSTLAASLAPTWPLVSDDYLLLERAGDARLVQPSATRGRLSPAASHALGDLPALRRLHGKLEVALPSADSPRPLTRLYLLETADDVGITRLRQRDALLGLASQLHRIDAVDPALLAAEVDFLADLVEKVGIAKLRYPRRFDALGEVAEAIAADLQTDDDRTRNEEAV